MVCVRAWSVACCVCYGRAIIILSAEVNCYALSLQLCSLGARELCVWRLFVMSGIFRVESGRITKSGHVKRQSMHRLWSLCGH